MNQLRKAFFGSHQPKNATNSPIDSQRGPPQLSVPIPAGSIDGSELDRITSGDMATDVQSQQPAGFTADEVQGLKAAQEEGQTVACPDPSAHQHGHKLSDQASKAALYVTHPERATNPATMNPLGPDGKLSSAGAATSLKHARAQDLPSFPSTGGVNANHSHGAANLAHDNQKPFEHWKPDPSEHAGKAAMLAKDYKMQPLWKPEMSAAGGKAAVLAHRDGGKLDLWMPEATKEGHSAATLAMGKKNLGPNVQIGANADQKAKALMAATGAHNDAARKRASSQPSTRPGTTLSNRRVEEVDANNLNSPAMQAARAQHLHMSREMFTEHPPVEQFDKQEQQHQAALRASAVSMAKKLYATQQHHINAASGATSGAGAGASAATRNSQSGPALTESNLKQAAMQHLTLQEAAQRLAEERLAKMKTDDEEAFRAHYGYGRSPSKKLSNRFSVRGRKRASSDVTGDQNAEEPKPFDRWADSDDEEESRRIREQTRRLRGQVADVDANKQKKDRQALLAAAEKNVHARMNKMDERVFNDTGKMSPAMMEDYERKAQKRLEEKRLEEIERRKSQDTDAVTGQKKERVHIGGGKHMDMADIEAIARQRLQGTLQEIDEQAEKKRAEDEEVRQTKEDKKREATLTKERERERKAEEKQIRADEKQQAKDKKEAEKVKRQEEKRMSKMEKERLRDHPLPEHHDDHAPALENDETSAGALAAESPEIATSSEAVAAPAVSAVPVTIAATTTGPPAGTVEPMITGTELEPEPASEIIPAAAPPPADNATPVVTSVAPPLTVPATEADGLRDVEPTATNDTAVAGSTLPKTSVETNATASTEKASMTSPPDSPTEKESKGLRGFLGKLKRKSKAEPGQIKGFAGGHRLSKQNATDDEVPTNGNATSGATGASATTTADAPVAAAAATSTGRDSPDISSLDESDEEEPRGRTRDSPHLAPPASDEVDRKLSASNTNSTTGKTDEFEEARDTFDETLSPPQPAFTSAKKASSAGDGSPHRDSKFVENV